MAKQLANKVERLRASLREVVAADLDSRQRCADYIVEIERLKDCLAMAHRIIEEQDAEKKQKQLCIDDLRRQLREQELENMRARGY